MPSGYYFPWRGAPSKRYARCGRSISRRRLFREALFDAALERGLDSVGAYPQRVYRDTQIQGELLAVVDLGAPVLLVVLKHEVALSRREGLHTLVQAFIHLLRPARLVRRDHSDG